MFNDLLIVFSNYNGMRSRKGWRKPRIKLTIDSFRNKVPYWEELNCIILDNNSTDKSRRILEEYQTDNWKLIHKQQEDFYLGTMCNLLEQYKSEYKLIMLVDNDQYFVRPGFLDTAMAIMSSDEYVCCQLNEITIADLIDHDKKMGIVGVFDEIGEVKGDIYLRAARFNGKESCWENLRVSQGTGMIHCGRQHPKRACWLWFGASNVILKTEPVSTIFKREECRPPYKKNSERLALFASHIGRLGRTAWLARGGSVNFGHRKYLSKGYNLKRMVRRYENGKNGLFQNDNYSYLLKDGKLTSIEAELRKLND